MGEYNKDKAKPLSWSREAGKESVCVDFEILDPVRNTGGKASRDSGGRNCGLSCQALPAMPESGFFLFAAGGRKPQLWQEKAVILDDQQAIGTGHRPDLL